MSLFLDDGDVQLWHGDALTVLQTLEDESVHMCVTSPPFFGLRDYQTGRWEGGNPDCDHVKGTAREGRSVGTGRHTHSTFHGSMSTTYDGGPMYYGQTCGKCGAQRVDQQIGLEETPEAWVERLVAVFREVRRVLRADGTLWLELGDSFLPGKQLGGMPWKMAFALQDDGWILRSDIIFSRPNPMPESVTDRPTKSHSYIFLLAKQPRYFFDQEAVREPLLPGTRIVEGGWDGQSGGLHNGRAGGKRDGGVTHPNGRNVRSVWNIATQPYPEAHFATFPEELARRCILAGSPEGGRVLDPFVGSGTVPYVARKHGRHAIGIDLSHSYLELAARRLQQLSLFA